MTSPFSNPNVSDNSTSLFPLYLGCPVWACSAWGGEVYPPSTRREHWLNWYSKTFNTVEGNSVFYALPTLDNVRKWCRETHDGFRFALKVPRVISHEGRLQKIDSELRSLCAVLEVLATHNRLGPTFLQLPPNFSPSEMPTLKSFLWTLPREFPWAVEVRHHDWFDQSDNEGCLDDLLRTLRMDKVLFDSRPLYQSPPDDEHEQVSQTRKPQTPYRETVTSNHPMLRIVGRNKTELAAPFVEQWAAVIAKWILQGLQPFVFTHAPDDAFAPAFARQFAAAISIHLPSHAFTIPSLPPVPRQQNLFD